MAIIVPNQFHSYSTNGSQPGSEEGAWAWIGLTTPITASGQVTFYSAASPLAGYEIGTFYFFPGHFDVKGPISSKRGLCWDGLTGGCALVWLRNRVEDDNR